MTTQTSLLRLILPVQGEFSGTWGDQVNAGLTNLVDTAIAGATTLSSDADVTLTTSNYAADQARSAILICSGARTATRNIIAPSSSKTYVVINATTQSVVLKGTATTGTTVAAGTAVFCAWNGTDFAPISGYIGIPQNIQSAGYTLVASDNGKHIYMNSAGTYTIPANASVAFPIGAAVTFINMNAASTIAITSDTLYWSGSGTTGSRVIAQYGFVTVLKIAATSWIISGTGIS